MKPAVWDTRKPIVIHGVAYEPDGAHVARWVHPTAGTLQVEQLFHTHGPGTEEWRAMIETGRPKASGEALGVGRTRAAALRNLREAVAGLAAMPWEVAR